MLRVRIGPAAPKAAALVVPDSRPEAEIRESFPPAGRTVHLGLGDPEAAGATAAAHLLHVPRIALDARALPPAAAVAFATGACLRAWRYDRLKTRAEPDAARLAALDLLTDDPAALTAAWRPAEAALLGVEFARNLVAEPSNTLTPDGFIDRLGELADLGVGITIMKPGDLRRAGLGALLAVGRGSVHPPRLVVLRWPGRGTAAPVAFVGKGITFDTGGICIKPALGMQDMRADMAGAAACAGAIFSIARRRSPCPAVAVLALAENATGADSYRPGDVLRTYSGQTVEVIDTDAEGRLVLADALAWTARRLRPRAMIDLATLTGAIVTTLGHHMAGMFDNSSPLAAELAAAGSAVGELLWKMPIGEGHREDLKSDIADLKNCLSGRGHPDACHAAAFLREFVEGIPWAHLDIAGVELRETADQRHAAGATGFGVRLLDRLVAQYYESPG